MAQPCASTTTRTPCCRLGGARCNGKKVAAVASVEIDALIGPPAGGTEAGMKAPAHGATPAAKLGCSCGGSGGASAAAPPPAVPPAQLSDAVGDENPVGAPVSRELGPEEASVGIGMSSPGAPHGPLDPPKGVRMTVAAATVPVQPAALTKSASSRKRSASAVIDLGIADSSSGPRQGLPAVPNWAALSPTPRIGAVATAPLAAVAAVAAASPPTPRPKRSRRVVGRDPMPREQRVYFTCAVCGHDRNHIRKRTCDRCRAPKIAMPSGSAAEAARSARRAVDAELRREVAATAAAESRDRGGAEGGARGSLPSLAPAPADASEAGDGQGGGRGARPWPSLAPALGGRPPASVGANRADDDTRP